MARFLLGVSGGIAAYKSLELARLATLAGHGVRVVMTDERRTLRRRRLVRGDRRRPGADLRVRARPDARRLPRRSRRGGHDPIGHLELAANCDAFLVAPASANTIAKLAGGFADSMLTTSFLACTAPRLVAPAMNDRMYADAATQANLATLRERGVEVIEPDEGLLASRGEHGRGRLPDPEALLARVEAVLAGGERGATSRAPPGTRPAGPGTACASWSPPAAPASRSTRCASSATAPAGGWASPSPRRPPRRGAEVTLVAANVALPAPAGVKRIDVETTDRARHATAERFETQHVLLMAAAPADFRAEPIAGKLKRQDGLNLHLQPTEDILAGSRPQRAREPDGRRLRRRARRRRDRPGPRQARPARAPT